MDDNSISRSQLGKRIVSYMLLAGLIPLIVFTVPMYVQSWNVMQDNARQSLNDYSELAAGQLFQTIQQGQQRLIRLAQAGNYPVPPGERSYFSTIHRLQKLESMDEFAFYDSLDVSDLQESLTVNDPETYLTPAYRTRNGPTVSMITRAQDGTFWVGEIEPSVLWETFRGSLFGERDLALVLDERGRILSASRSLFKPLAPLENYFSESIPKSGKGEGTETLAGFGKSLWISKQLWLKGAFGTGKWQLVFFRKQEAVQSLSMGLLGSLGIWLFLALAGLILISFRFARQLYRPIQKLNHATHQLIEGNWDGSFTVDTGDELEELARNFLVMRDTIKETNDQLKHDATHDRLTDLPNRVLLEERIQHLINYTDRNEEYCFAVVFLDLDRFKVVNDSLGHKAGDELLKEVGERLNGSIRKTDMVSRLGGDEFVLVMDSVHDADEAVNAVEKVVQCFDAPFTIHGKELALDSSLGIALYDHQYSTAEEMLRDADTAMYRSKNGGSNGSNYVVFRGIMREQGENHLDLETNIQKVVSED